MSSVMRQNATCCQRASNTVKSATYAKLQLSGNATKNFILPLNAIRPVARERDPTVHPVRAIIYIARSVRCIEAKRRCPDFCAAILGLVGEWTLMRSKNAGILCPGQIMWILRIKSFK